jgi:hypothetical protein
MDWPDPLHSHWRYLVLRAAVVSQPSRATPAHYGCSRNEGDNEVG